MQVRHQLARTSAFILADIARTDRRSAATLDEADAAAARFAAGGVSQQAEWLGAELASFVAGVRAA